MTLPSVAAILTPDAAANTDPAVRHATIVPSDVTPVSPVPRALLVTVAGNVQITDYAGVSITYPSVPAYTRLDIRAKYVGAATTATVVAWA